MKRTAAIIVSLAFLFPAFGCLSTKPGSVATEVCEADPSAEICTEGLPSSIRWFAVKADYVRIKSAAAAYVEAPTTPQPHRQLIAIAVVVGDAIMEAVETARANGTEDANDYVTASRALRSILVRISALTITGSIVN